jgi:hypothetical protein
MKQGNSTMRHRQTVMIVATGLACGWGAPIAPAEALEPSAQVEVALPGGNTLDPQQSTIATDFAMPRRIVCLSGANLEIKREAARMTIGVMPVPGKVVGSASELKPGQCAGLRTSDNELAPKSYGAFGPKVRGPLIIELRSSTGLPRVTLQKDGRVQQIELGPRSLTGAIPSGNESESFRSILRWASAGSGGLEVAITMNTNDVGAGFIANLGAPTTYRP